MRKKSVEADLWQPTAVPDVVLSWRNRRECATTQSFLRWMAAVLVRGKHSRPFTSGVDVDFWWKWAIVIKGERQKVYSQLYSLPS